MVELYAAEPTKQAFSKGHEVRDGDLGYFLLGTTKSGISVKTDNLPML